MLRFEFTTDELNLIKSKIHFTDLQKRLINYRRDEWTIAKMAMQEKWSERKISREFNKINKKIVLIILIIILKMN